MPGGWYDPWDTDPLDPRLATLRRRTALRRHVSESGVHAELQAEARADGRWEAHVVSSDGSLAFWPSVNGPTATSALDALEAELRELLRGSSAVPDTAR